MDSHYLTISIPIKKLSSLFAYLLAPLRLLLAVGMLLVGLLLALFAKQYSDRVFYSLAMGWHQAFLAVLGVRRRVSGEPIIGRGLLVSNHISWLDAMVFGASAPVVFLCNHEVRGWPLIGRVVSAARTLYIERGKGAEMAAQAIAQGLTQGRLIMLFPEARTSDGLSMRRFHPRLLNAAVDQQAEAQGASLRFYDNQGKRTTIPSFAENISFFTSLWRVICAPRITAKVVFMEPSTGTNARLVCQTTEQQIRLHIEDQTQL